MQLKPGHYPVNQEARPIPLHLQEAVGTKFTKIRTFGMSETRKRTAVIKYSRTCRIWKKC